MMAMVALVQQASRLATVITRVPKERHCVVTLVTHHCDTVNGDEPHRDRHGGQGT
jgi:hypothetical protein